MNNNNVDMKENLKDFTRSGAKLIGEAAKVLSQRVKQQLSSNTQLARNLSLRLDHLRKSGLTNAKAKQQVMEIVNDVLDDIIKEEQGEPESQDSKKRFTFSRFFRHK